MESKQFLCTLFDGFGFGERWCGVVVVVVVWCGVVVVNTRRENKSSGQSIKDETLQAVSTENQIPHDQDTD